MAEADFPSGPWTGFYQYQDGQRGHQDLLLQFANGRMTGTGVDEVGNFFVEGTYDASSKEARWLKTFPMGHSVAYQGYREGPVAELWGTWSTSPEWTGGFHIWPLNETLTPREEDETAEPWQVDRPEPVFVGYAIASSLDDKEVRGAQRH